METISVLMCTYKEPIEWINKTIDSVIHQTLIPTEYIIIVDNPEYQELISVLEEYKNKYKYIKYYVNNKNMGLVKSLNYGLTKCNGKYIARIDADDFAETERFEKQLEYLKNNNLDFVGCGYNTFYDDKILCIREGTPGEENLKKILKFSNCIAHPTWFLKKKVYDELQGYRDIQACEDLDFIIRAVLNGYKIGNVKECLMWYRDNPNSISHKNSYKQEATKIILCRYYRRHNIISLENLKKIQNGKSYKRLYTNLEKISEGSLKKYFYVTFYIKKIKNKYINICKKKARGKY